MTHRNLTITRKDFQKDTSRVQKICEDVSANRHIFRIILLFQQNLGILRIKNKFLNVFHVTKQILIQLMRAMFFLAAARAEFRNIYSLPTYVIKVSCEKLLYIFSN